MKWFFVFVLATAIFSVSSTNIKSVFDLNREFSKNNSGLTRIVSGQATSDGQFPYHVRVTVYESADKDAAMVGWCGGALISEEWVLTTGHCLTLCNGENDTPLYYVEAGSIWAGHPRQATVAYYTDVYPHPEFYPDYFYNDIGLIKTGGFDCTTPFIQPIPLVASGTDSSLYEGHFVTVSGFGYTSNDGPTSDQVLFTHQLKVISMDTCSAQYAEDSVPSTSFCAQDFPPPVTAACYGDAGGPAIMQMDDVMTLVGLVSFGLKDGCDKAAQGFTDVAQYNDWVQEVIDNN